MSAVGSDPDVPVSELLFELPIQEMLYELLPWPGTTASAPRGSRRGQQTPPGKTLTCSFIFVSPPCAPYQESSRGRSLSFWHPNARTRRWSPPSPRRPPKRRRLLRAVSRARRRVLGHYLHSELNFPLFGLLGHDPDCLCITGYVQKCFGTFGSIKG